VRVLWMVFILLLTASFSGCTMPLKITIYTSPEDVSVIEESEDELILNTFKALDERLIVLAFEKEGVDRFTISRLLTDSQAKDFEEFLDYIGERIIAEVTISRETLDEGYFRTIRENYNQLKEMYTNEEEAL